MKVYVVEYDFEIIKANFALSDTEHRVYSFTNVTEFIEQVKSLQGKYYISDIKTYTGEVKEIEMNKVLNPF